MSLRWINKQMLAYSSSGTLLTDKRNSLPTHTTGVNSQRCAERKKPAAEGYIVWSTSRKASKKANSSTETSACQPSPGARAGFSFSQIEADGMRLEAAEHCHTGRQETWRVCAHAGLFRGHRSLCSGVWYMNPLRGGEGKSGTSSRCFLYFVP